MKRINRNFKPCLSARSYKRFVQNIGHIYHTNFYYLRGVALQIYLAMQIWYRVYVIRWSTFTNIDTIRQHIIGTPKCKIIIGDIKVFFSYIAIVSMYFSLFLTFSLSPFLSLIFSIIFFLSSISFALSISFCIFLYSLYLTHSVSVRSIYLFI